MRVCVCVFTHACVCSHMRVCVHTCVCVCSHMRVCAARITPTGNGHMTIGVSYVVIINYIIKYTRMNTSKHAKTTFGEVNNWHKP